ncbi:16S rRNA (cytidine(1402)-2'-O)-methyltransferase [Candidatus Legionella polyplacis]|uniref:Ribosomal RNA small subunit methyltransferase I n=1 Tax=Candidatus Legionella polyplacis TaxID=2005262 RepID=A0ABZ2GV79_9GAMM|nr:16S rRNA (cytidine(1402)-2'-O)-methyltransferase [Candidatus Legionella polyplacis]ATW01896.1 16S rRNA (cytidine(1402)-2'-O)-methyltransferase [Candidatus Legionella polyplacis]
MLNKIGKLYIVATPIGNRDDISLRAIKILKKVNYILSENTKYSYYFLKSLNIIKPLISFHIFNENKISNHIINKLKNGKSFALISNAGTPLINDPGFPLVKKARKENIPVIPIPGACALIAAICSSGIPCNTFFFTGFLSSNTNNRKKQLKYIKYKKETTIIYETKHKIIKSINNINEIYGIQYKYVIFKEITKSFETFIFDTGDKIKSWILSNHSNKKGEFIIILPKIYYKK